MKAFNIGSLAIQIPVVQGGMGVGISLSGLASAVANEGGVGIISSAGMGLLYREYSKDYIKASILGLKEELAKAKAKTKGIIGVNIMVAMSNFTDMAKAAIKEKADIIFSGAGMPLELPSHLEEGDETKLVPIVSSARAAKIICEKWRNNYSYQPDAIVVEGTKAGGHLGFKLEQITDSKFCLESLVSEVKSEVDMVEQKSGKKIPIIAAGGIYTGGDIFDIMKYGADAVQMGTRFVTTYECDAAAEFKQAYIDAEEKDIEIIQSPVGMPGRAILSPFIQKVRNGEKQPKDCPFNCIKTCDISKSPYCIIMALYSAYKGKMDNGYAFAGSNAYRSTKLESVKEIFRALTAEYDLAALA